MLSESSPNEKTGELSRKRAKWNRGKQFNRYKLQSKGYKDAQGTYWYLQQLQELTENYNSMKGDKKIIKKDHSEIKKTMPEMKNMLKEINGILDEAEDWISYLEDK